MASFYLSPPPGRRYERQEFSLKAHEGAIATAAREALGGVKAEDGEDEATAGAAASGEGRRAEALSALPAGSHEGGVGVLLGQGEVLVQKFKFKVVFLVVTLAFSVVRGLQAHTQARTQHAET